MAFLRLEAPAKDYLWGGNRLKTEYGKKSDKEIIAETWELSCYPGSSSVIAEGEYAGMSLPDYIEKNGKEVLGTNCRDFQFFPVLIKFIDAAKDLSIQVHPSDEYAIKNENQYGKTEVWYIIDAEEGSFLYYGFKKEISKEEFEDRIKNNTLLEVLNAQPVKKGEVYFIKSGTLHAIGKGIMLAEIQQNSNVTYRIYDYGRRDKDGNLRELHIDKALEVTDRFPVKDIPDCSPHLASCKYFTVDKVENDYSSVVDEKSFLHVLVIDGNGELTCGKDNISLKKGDSILITAGSGDFTITGDTKCLLTSI